MAEHDPRIALVRRSLIVCVVAATLACTTAHVTQELLST